MTVAQNSMCISGILSIATCREGLFAWFPVKFILKYMYSTFLFPIRKGRFTGCGLHNLFYMLVEYKNNMEIVCGFFSVYVVAISLMGTDASGDGGFRLC